MISTIWWLDNLYLTTMVMKSYLSAEITLQHGYWRNVFDVTLSDFCFCRTSRIQWRKVFDGFLQRTPRNRSITSPKCEGFTKMASYTVLQNWCPILYGKHKRRIIIAFVLDWEMVYLIYLKRSVENVEIENSRLYRTYNNYNIENHLFTRVYIYLPRIGGRKHCLLVGCYVRLRASVSLELPKIILIRILWRHFQIVLFVLAFIRVIKSLNCLM